MELTVHQSTEYYLHPIPFWPTSGKTWLCSNHCNSRYKPHRTVSMFIPPHGLSRCCRVQKAGGETRNIHYKCITIRIDQKITIFFPQIFYFIVIIKNKTKVDKNLVSKWHSYYSSLGWRKTKFKSERRVHVITEMSDSLPFLSKKDHKYLKRQILNHTEIVLSSSISKYIATWI